MVTCSSQYSVFSLNIIFMKLNETADLEITWSIQTILGLSQCNLVAATGVRFFDWRREAVIIWTFSDSIRGSIRKKPGNTGRVGGDSLKADPLPCVQLRQRFSEKWVILGG